MKGVVSWVVQWVALHTTATCRQSRGQDAWAEAGGACALTLLAAAPSVEASAPALGVAGSSSMSSVSSSFTCSHPSAGEHCAAQVQIRPEYINTPQSRLCVPVDMCGMAKHMCRKVSSCGLPQNLLLCLIHAGKAGTLASL